jgi:hypothetical protein
VGRLLGGRDRVGGPVGGRRAAAGEGGEPPLGPAEARLPGRRRRGQAPDLLHLPLTPEAAAMREELLDYEIKVSEDANERYGAFKVGAHDDLVTALGLAVQEGPDRAVTVRSYLPKAEPERGPTTWWVGERRG